MDPRKGKKTRLMLSAKKNKRIPPILRKIKEERLRISDGGHQEHSQSIRTPQQKVKIHISKQEVFETDKMTQYRDITGNPCLDDVLGSFQVKEESNDSVQVTDESGDGPDISQLKTKKRKRNNDIEDSKPSSEAPQTSLSTETLQASYCEIDDICRLCGIKLEKEERTQSGNDVFSSNYPLKILKCTSLKVKEGDGLPQKICIECIANLNRAYDFRNICIHTYKFMKQSTFKNSLERNSAYSGIYSIQERDKDNNKSDHKENKTRQHFSGRQRVPNVIDSIKNETSFRSSVSPADGDTAGDYSDNNIDTYFDQDSIEDNEDTQTETNTDLGYCDARIKTELDDDDDDVSFSHPDFVPHENGSEVEKEGGKQIFNLNYPTSKSRYVERAKKDIEKYFRKGGTDVLCPFCPAVFNLELYTELQLHLDSHLHCKDNVFICRYEDCEESFKSPITRKTHEGTDHGKQQLEGRVLFCDHCAEMIKPATYCKSHRSKRERSDTIFQCERCPFRSRDRLRLSHHIKGLHESQQVSCKLCNTMLPLNKLRYHMNNEHRAKIPCGFCNKEFLPRNIKGHLRTHTGEKPFSCADCGLEFTFRVSLKTHRKRYHGDNMFEVKKEV